MAILERISSLLCANINDALDRAEDPEKMIKQVLLDMRVEQVTARTEVVLAIGEEQQFSRHYEEHLEKVNEWQHKAQLAVARGQDDTAREALHRRDAFQQAAERYEQRRDWQAQQIASLQEALARLGHKIDDAEAHKDTLIARHHCAKAETEIRGALGGHRIE
jgi:phage shock protein A